MPRQLGRHDLIPLPESVDPRGGPVAGEADAEDLVTLDASGASIEPANYAFNATLTNLAPRHAAGHTGAAIVIAAAIVPSSGMSRRRGFSPLG